MSTRSVTSGDTSSARAAIEVVDLKHTYDGKNYALKGVTFSVGRGEVFGLLGKNGAGKSTLIKVLTTLIRPTSGSLSILGMDPVHQGKEIRSKIGVVQQAESFDFTSVEGNFDIYGILWGVPREERVKRKNELISKFGLETVRKRRSFDLSGGQKRRVQVAREMMHDMEILFLDEPTVGLDVIMRRELLESIRAEVRRGLTVVFTTHNLDEADYLCDRVAVIDLGKIIAMDTVEDLKRLYGGKKTVEVTVGGGDYQGFYEGLRARLAGMDIKVDGKSGIVLADNPKEVLQVVLELSQKSGVQLDWLNIRKNTLEDVFIDSISRGEVDQ